MPEVRQLVGTRTVSVEHKYDGEYCQIHIRRHHTNTRSVSFPKGGRDLTRDRAGLHGYNTKCLGVGTAQCKFQRQCILVGELLVWNNHKQQIVPFHRIRLAREGLDGGTF
jgi:DNA ligase-4